jgi:hypothetical protein
MRNNEAKSLITSGPTAYSPEKHKLLEGAYASAHALHQRSRDASNSALRDLRAAERQLARAAKEFVNYTALKLAIDAGASVLSETSRVLALPPDA